MNLEYESKMRRDFIQDPELERIENFAEELCRVKEVRELDTNFDFSNSQPIDLASRQFLTYEHSPVPTVYMTSELQLPIKEADQVLFEPLVSRAGKRSGHGVFFGEMYLGSDSVRIAVKPHLSSDGQESCLKDYFNNAAVARLGLYTLQSAGLFIPHPEQAYSFTVLDESLTTLDSVEWSDFASDIDGNPGMQETWLHVARQTAVLHSMGSMCHGDLAARNIANSVDGSVFFIDWEHANINTNPPRDAEIRYGFSSRDLADLLDSVCVCESSYYGRIPGGGVCIINPDTPDKWGVFEDFFFNEYRTYRLEIAQEGSHSSSRVAEVEAELKQIEYLLKSKLSDKYNQ